MRLFQFMNGGKLIPTKRDKDYTMYIFNSVEDSLLGGLCPSTIVNYLEYFHQDLLVEILINEDSYFNAFFDDILSISIPNNLVDTVDFEIEGDVGLILNAASPRRPGYCIRGHKLSEQEAFEVLANSDEAFTSYFTDLQFRLNISKSEVESLAKEASLKVKDVIQAPYRNIGNKFIQGQGYTWVAGFVFPNGAIGCNHWAYKYPECYEIYLDTLSFARRFPFLKFCVAVTSWNEVPDEFWDMDDHTFQDVSEYVKRDLQYCLYAHDGIVEVQDDLKQYFEFDSEYIDKRIFDTDEYWAMQKRCPYTKDYLISMLKSHNIEEGMDLYNYCINNWEYLTNFYKNM